MPPKHQRPKVRGETSRVPKRPRTRKEPTQVPVEEPPPLPNRKFVSPEAEQNFETGYGRRAVLCERGIHIELFQGHPHNLLSLIASRGWEHWVRFQHKVFVPLVREFYSNIVATRANNGGRCITSYVRKAKIELKPSDIAELFHIPREASHRAESEAEVDLRKENLAKLLAENEEAVWIGPALSKKVLSERCNILHRLLCSHLIPQAFTSSVSLKQAIFMGKLLLGVHIDLAKHIFEVINEVAKNPCGAGGLPFGGLISYYLLKNGVKAKAKYEVIYPMDRISPALTRRSSGQLKRKDVQIQEIQESPLREQLEGPSQALPSQEDHSLQGIYDMIRSMQERQEDMFKELKERQEANHSEVMKMYHDLDEKVNQLLEAYEEESSSEATPPPIQPPSSVPPPAPAISAPTPAAVGNTMRTPSEASTEECSSGGNCPQEKE